MALVHCNKTGQLVTIAFPSICEYLPGTSKAVVGVGRPRDRLRPVGYIHDILLYSVYSAPEDVS